MSTKLDKVIYTAKAHTTGGRDGATTRTGALSAAAYQAAPKTTGTNAARATI